MRRRIPAAIAAVAVLAIAGPVAASTADGGANIAAAKAGATPYLKPMTSLPLPQLKNPAAKNKSVALLPCSTPACNVIFKGAIAAVKALGWKYKLITFEPTADGVQKAMQAAVDMKVDGIAITSLPSSLYPQQLAAAKAAGIPVVTGNTPDVLGTGIIANVEPNKAVEGYARVLADWIVSQLGASADVGFFNVPDFPALVAYQNAFQKEFKRLCPACKFTPVKLQVSDIGTKVPSIVVATAQRDPKMNYAVMAWGDVSAGVRTALDLAGKKNVKIGGIAASTPNIQALVNGTEDAWVSPPLMSEGWKRIDALVRQFNGEDVSVDSKAPFPMQLQTSQNTKTVVLPEVVNVDALFKKIWKIS